MKPKIGQKLTYVDESCTEYTAKVTEFFLHEDKNYTVSIEYRHEDRTTRTVKGVPFIVGMHNVDSQEKVKCFTKKTSKPQPKKATTNEPKVVETTATATGPETVTATETETRSESTSSD